MVCADGVGHRETDDRRMRQARKAAVLERAHARARRRGVLVALYAPVRLLLVPVLRLWFRLRVSRSRGRPGRRARDHRAQPQELHGCVLRGRRDAPARALHGQDGDLPGPAGVAARAPGSLPGPPRGGRCRGDAHRAGDPRAGRRRRHLPGRDARGGPRCARCAHITAPAGSRSTRARRSSRRRSAARRTCGSGRSRSRGGCRWRSCPRSRSPVAATPDAVSEIVDRELWPAVQAEYGRLRARPGLVLAGLAAIGLGGGLVARRRAAAKPRILGVVPPRRLRRRRRRLPDRLRRR